MFPLAVFGRCWCQRRLFMGRRYRGGDAPPPLPTVFVGHHDFATNVQD